MRRESISIGHIKPYPDASDLGRFEVTGSEADRMSFRVPGLRNVAMTAPYYHDGGIAGLDEAVRSMATHQLGIELAPADEAAILAFLDALTGVPPAGYIQKPEPPPGGEVERAPRIGEARAERALAPARVSLIPQLHLAFSKRGHVALNLGLELPLAGARPGLPLPLPRLPALGHGRRRLLGGLVSAAGPESDGKEAAGCGSARSRSRGWPASA